MNYLEALKTLAKYTDPQSVDTYDTHISAIGLIMEILTLALFASFGGVAIKKVALRAYEMKHRISRGMSSGEGDTPKMSIKTMVARRSGELKGRILRSFSSAEAPQIESSQTTRSSGALTVEMAEQAKPKFMHQNPMAPAGGSELGSSNDLPLPAGWGTETTPEGRQYFFNKKTGECWS